MTDKPIIYDCPRCYKTCYSGCIVDRSFCCKCGYDLVNMPEHSCPKCHHVYDGLKDDKYCRHCGEKISGTKEKT